MAARPLPSLPSAPMPQFLPPLLVDSAIRIDFFMFSKVRAVSCVSCVRVSRWGAGSRVCASWGGVWAWLTWEAVLASPSTKI